MFKDLNKFKKLETTKQETEKKKTNKHDTASKLCNELLETYFDEYYYLLHANRKKWVTIITWKVIYWRISS